MVLIKNTLYLKFSYLHTSFQITIPGMTIQMMDSNASSGLNRPVDYRGMSPPRKSEQQCRIQRREATGPAPTARPPFAVEYLLQEICCWLSCLLSNCHYSLGNA